MEQVIFAEAIWRAFAQCFLTHDEAVQAIDDYGRGLLHNVRAKRETHMQKPEDTTSLAGGSPLERGVGRPAPERANVAYLTGEANPMKDAEPGRRFWVARGCYECAWGKVLGCWRCGGR